MEHMKTRIFHIWESIRTSFWFVPSIMVSLSIITAFAVVALDRKIELESTVYGLLYKGGPEGARSILSTIASSMMTVAGVTFSITIVTLTLTSSQFGPRLLRNFMRDTGNQVVLGSFISTFMYCLVVLLLANVIEGELFVPGISVSFAVLLALANVGVLIYFIHHVSTSIQADKVIEAVYRDLLNQIGKLFPEQAGREKDQRTDRDPEPQPRDDHRAHRIVATESGYLQAMDFAGLLELAGDNDLLITTHFKPGKYIFAGNTLATVRGPETIDDALSGKVAGCFISGSQRTPEQDAEFAISQLVEIAVRALSPSTNDPYTAMTCLDRLGSAFCYLATRAFPSPYRYDDKGRLRVIAKPVTFSGIANEAFNQIRQYGRSSVAVTIRLLETLQQVALHTREPEQLQAIVRQAHMTAKARFESIADESDRQDVEQRYHALLDACNMQDPPAAPLSRK
jgi:uncharacterized membrane protein